MTFSHWTFIFLVCSTSYTLPYSLTPFFLTFLTYLLYTLPPLLTYLLTQLLALSRQPKISLVAWDFASILWLKAALLKFGSINRITYMYSKSHIITTEVQMAIYKHQTAQIIAVIKVLYKNGNLFADKHLKECPF